MNAVIKLITGALLLSFFPASAGAQRDSFNIYFATGITYPDASQEAYIDSLLYVGKLPGSGALAIIGYGDEPGGAALNKIIAEKRAASVKAYLLSGGVDANRIRKCVGAGNLVHSGADFHQRRVDIIVVKRDSLWQAEEAAPATVKTDSAAAGKKPKRSLRDLARMKEDELLVIENLLFKVSTSEFEKESLPVLDELVDVLKDYPQLKIRIEGHICCGTNSTETDKLRLGYHLSLERARAVKMYLEEHQIAESRLSFVGFGFSRPKVYPEKTQEDMSMNRRVEIRVVSN